MQLGSLELQIFVALFLVLGSAFVALVCDMLKGNNEHLRELNIELRVRQDERERLGLFEPLSHPITWLQGLAQLIRNPETAGAAAAAAREATATAAAAGTAPGASATGPNLENLTAAATPAAEEAAGDDRNPQRRHRYDEFKASASNQTWATKEELEQLAGRAARIRARHEASHRKFDDVVVAPPAAVPAAAAETKLEAEAPRRPKLTELPRLEQPAAVASRLQPVALVATPAVEEPVLTEIAQPAVHQPAVMETPQVAVPHQEYTLVAPEAHAVVVAEVARELVQPPTATVEAVAEVAQELPAIARPVEAVAADVVAEVTPSVSAAVEPPPMVQTPVPNAWNFTPAPVETPKEVGAVVATPDMTRPVIKPEAPMLASSLPELSLPESLPEVVAPPAFVEADMVQPAVVAMEAVTDTEPEVNIWLTAEDAEAAKNPPVSYEAPPMTPAETVEASVPEPGPEAHTFGLEAVRTRIQPIVVPPLSEADTADVVPPAVAVKPHAAPSVEPVPLQTVPAMLDVAALQKATGESLPALRSSITDLLNDGKLEIPSGLHEGSVLSQLLENQSSYSGVVVAIGLNEYETLREKLSSGNDSIAALNKMVLSMLRPQDFACRFQEDEYILIYPGERGSSAQRRLFQVSEKLWDFQLRSLGNLSVMFSWGGLEVTNETLAEAVASARERMYQTKRNRKPSGLEFAVGRKKVVNG